MRTIVKNSETLLENAKTTPHYISVKLTCLQSNALEKIKQLLSTWCENLHKANTPISLALIQEKAPSLYNYVRIEEGETDSMESFNASRNWFHQFQSRYGFKNVWVQGEAASADVEGDEAFAKILKEAISGEGLRPSTSFQCRRIRPLLEVHAFNDIHFSE